MTERRSILRPEIGDPNREMLHEVIHGHLLRCIEAMSKDLDGASGCSLVLSSIGVWTQELHELDPALTASYFRSLATMTDPKSTRAQHDTAERIRRDIFEKLTTIARQP